MGPYRLQQQRQNVRHGRMRRRWVRTLGQNGNASVEVTSNFLYTLHKYRVNCLGTGGRPPVSLAEITFDADCCGGKDFYDVSLVDGYNLPLAMTPIAGTYILGTNDRPEYDCKAAGCFTDINSICPTELQLFGSGGVVACKSACEAFNTDQYCCRGANNTPDTCPPFSYSQLFKNVSACGIVALVLDTSAYM